MKNNKIILIAIVMLSITGCVSTSNLPQYNKIGLHPYGSVIKMNYRSDEFLAGELIALKDSNIIILNFNNNKCLEIPMRQIKKYEVKFAQSKHYGYAIPLLSASTISHGFFALISFPVNLISTIIITATAESAYSINGNDLTLKQLNMYARFPQGLPDNIRLEDIH